MKYPGRWMLPLLRCAVALTILVFAAAGARAEENRALIAIASNFSETAKELGSAFQKETTGTIEFSFGSTGKQFTQIINGAPFDAFLSADSQRPKDLKARGLAIDQMVFTYAKGRLVLWGTKGTLISDGSVVLRQNEFHKLALAKPELAPYGLAAKQTLTRLNLWNIIQPKLVYGDNISQTLQFADTGNADYAFLAKSQVVEMKPPHGWSWYIPEEYHDPIIQDAILLKQNSTAKKFLEYLKTPRAIAIIRAHGYDIP